MNNLSQQTRLIILIMYVAILFIVTKVLFDTWLPPTSEKGLWFYSGLASLLLGSLLLEPFYSRPCDCVANGVAALISLLAVSVYNPKYSAFDRYLWVSLLIYAAMVIITSIMAIAFMDSSNTFFEKLAASSRLLSEYIGAPRFVFSVVYWFALIVFHRQMQVEFLVIGIVWVVIIVARPLEIGAYLLRRWKQIFISSEIGNKIGKVVGYQHPKFALVSKQTEDEVKFGDILAMKADDGEAILSMALDHIGYADGYWLRTINIPLSNNHRQEIIESLAIEDANEPVVLQLENEVSRSMLDGNDFYEKRNKLIGFVSKNSDIKSIKIEIIRTDISLAEGRLVEVPIGDKDVLYQVFNGLTQEEILQQKNDRGYVQANARKIGCWNAEKGIFDIVKWVPEPNSPVFLMDRATAQLKADSIGHFPETEYPVNIDDIDSLVTHNTAILGILGVGKSYLGIELVERMLGEGIKVICLDLTDQYARHLEQFYDSELQEGRINELNEIGAAGKTAYHKNVEEGGSVLQFQNRVEEILSNFLVPDSGEQLLLFNPSDFDVWRQDSKPYKGVASMASLSPAFITRIFAEATLKILQSQGTSKKARCCLVLEEAHSLIPEFGSLIAEGDKIAVNGTARAVLQGRKFGLGCLVVTQRTANVTKTVLNQCNSIFALRVFDSTGMEFLKNYIGEDYVSVLSTLEDRHAIFFGRASSCQDPVLIRLNDREDFIEVFRNEN